MDIVIIARDKPRVEREASGIAVKHQVKSLGISADVSRKADIEAAASRIADAFDGVDILINNAGTGTSETIMEAHDDRWQHFWDLHCVGSSYYVDGGWLKTVE